MRRGGRSGRGGRGRWGGGAGGGRGGYDWTRHIPASHPMKRMGRDAWNALSPAERDAAKAQYRNDPDRQLRREQKHAQKRAADVATLEKMGVDPAHVAAGTFSTQPCVVSVSLHVSLSWCRVHL